MKPVNKDEVRKILRVMVLLAEGGRVVECDGHKYGLRALVLTSVHGNLTYCVDLKDLRAADCMVRTRLSDIELPELPENLPSPKVEPIDRDLLNEVRRQILLKGEVIYRGMSLLPLSLVLRQVDGQLMYFLELTDKIRTMAVREARMAEISVRQEREM